MQLYSRKNFVFFRKRVVIHDDASFFSYIDSRFYKIGIKAFLQATEKKEKEKKYCFFLFFLCDLMDRKIARPIYLTGIRTTTNEIYDS